MPIPLKIYKLWVKKLLKDKQCLLKTKVLHRVIITIGTRGPLVLYRSPEDMLKSAFTEEKRFKHSPRVGADNPLGPKFLCQQEGLITMVICCKFKSNLFNLTLYTSFHDLINVYSRRSGAGSPRGQNFDVNRNLLSLRSFAASLKKISLKSDFIQFFHDFKHVYSPGAGAVSPQGAKFWCQQEHLVTLVICCKFQKNLVWFYTIFFMIYTCI